MRFIQIPAALLMIAFISFACSSTLKRESAKPFVLPPPTAEPVAFDEARGAQIAQQGTPTGAASCIACHGQSGEGKAQEGFPRLAGQSRYYLVAQLEAYRSGTRENPVMAPIAKALSKQDQEDVAGYYQSLAKVPYVRAAKLAASQIKRAELLATYGDEKLGLQSCQNCHGPGGSGEPPSIPYLRGQHASYTAAQLAAWRSGTRRTNPEHMGYIAKLLNDADSKALANYFAQAR